MNRAEHGERIGPVRVLLAFALLGLCVWFIWSNSLLPPEASSRRSEAVAEFVTRVLGGLLGQNSAVVQFVRNHIRKIAHAVEFAVLGGVSAVMLIVLKRVSFGMLLHAASAVLAVAVVDESIQLFSGRGSQVQDILLDFAGGMGGLLFILLVYLLISRFFRTIRA